MYALTKISSAVAAISLSTLLFMSPTMAATTNANNNDISPVTNGVSQALSGDSKTVKSLNDLLPTIEYTTEGLSKSAKKINNAEWKKGMKIDRTFGTRACLQLDKA